MENVLVAREDERTGLGFFVGTVQPLLEKQRPDLLWIDPARGVSVQQQLVEPSGDYRLTKYSDIEVNQKIPDTVFKLKTTGRTKTVSPQG